MHFVSETSSDGVIEQLFMLGEIPGVLWTPVGAVGTRPLILAGHGGGAHKKAPGVASLAYRLVVECGFAVVAADVPNHGERPKNEEYHRIATENGACVKAGEEPAPLLASFHALVARQTVPEWRAVLDAVQELPHVGTGPVGYWGARLGRRSGTGVGVGVGSRADHRSCAVPGAVGRRADTASRQPGPVRRPGLGRENAARQPWQARRTAAVRDGQHVALLRPPPKLGRSSRGCRGS
jgi:hypothetical protein